MSSEVTLVKTQTPDGFIVRVTGEFNAEELAKYDIDNLPTVSLSRNGKKCIFRVDKMSEHTCWPIHKTPEAAEEYAQRVYKEIRAWFSNEGVDVGGGKKFKD